MEQLSQMTVPRLDFKIQGIAIDNGWFMTPSGKPIGTTKVCSTLQHHDDKGRRKMAKTAKQNASMNVRRLNISRLSDKIKSANHVCQTEIQRLPFCSVRPPSTAARIPHASLAHQTHRNIESSLNKRGKDKGYASPQSKVF